MVDWKRLNYALFSSAMQPPILELGESSSRLGFWNKTHRVLCISQHLITTQNWGVVTEVLKHEMAHQYVDEVLQVHHETAHGPAFVRLCERLAIDPKASGLPKSTEASKRSQKMEKVRRLLALANSPNKHEAQAATRAAKDIMLRYNLNLGANTPRYEFRQLGTPRQRRPVYHKVLASIITDHFFVDGIWVTAVDQEKQRRGRVLEVHGTAENLEVACWVWAFLLSTSDRLWANHKRETNSSSNRPRARFIAGVMLGFKEKLEQEQSLAEERGLIWVGDADLTNYMTKRHPRRRAQKTRLVAACDAFQSGLTQGRKMQIHQPIGQTPTPLLSTKS